MKTKWHKIKFILTPKEFEKIFKELDYYFPISNKRVDLDYKITDKMAVFNLYKLYYQKVISGKEWLKTDRQISFYASIIDNPKNINYEKFSIKENEKLKEYKRPVILKPVINIAPFTLSFDHKQRLSTIYTDTSNNSNIGLEFSYPKEIWENDKVVSTKLFSTYQLYSFLVKRIKEITHKAKINNNGVVLKPNFWISKSTIEYINNSIAIKNNGLQIISN